MNKTRNCDCLFCKNNLQFDLPKEIIDATIKGDLVVFAGAGISTETKKVFRETLYEDVAADLSSPADSELDFPGLMSLYCNRNINGRQKLLQKIKQRFDYCQQYSELYESASKFHKELSSIYYIKSIITTNWDDYFERECGAIPIVVPQDFTFHNIPDRKVYKIHGSISNYGTIVATKEDYDKCYRELNKGILGSYMKTILATKTIIFIGYSFRDYDFVRIYNYLKREMKDLLPHCYIVTIDSQAIQQFRSKNFTVINTDGSFFLSILREHLEGSDYLIPKENLQMVFDIKWRLKEIHEITSNSLDKSKQSNIIYCMFYQDGLMHALDYLIYHSKSGLSFYPLRILKSIESYTEVLRKKKVREKNYADVAYVDGYIQGLMCILQINTDEFPFWYLYGYGPTPDKKFFERNIKQTRVYHKSAETFGKKHFKKILSKNTELVLHHGPFL